MRCPNCQTVNPPDAKFCLECGNRLVICPRCGTVNLPIAKFCIECGLPLAPQAEQTPVLPQNGAAALPAPYSPVVENTRGAAPLVGNRSTFLAPEERRIVTIMFADIIGSTPLADKLDPEDMRAILAGYFNLMTEQIRRHGGTVEKYIGDAVMAVFGIPAAHEDDPNRAIRAALDMQAALNLFNARRLEHDPNATRLQMRIGINTGEVATPGADSSRQDFLITGDAVNVAARLQQVASPDTILVGERTYLTTRNVFEFRPIAPLHLKGKTQPVQAWAVQGMRALSPAIFQHPRGLEGLQSPLVGRTLELTLMHATYARVLAEQRPHLVTLLGAPGIGKSRLVREFIQREEEAAKSASHAQHPVSPLVLHGRCPPYGEGITYWPLIEILRTLLNVQEGETRAELEQRLVQYVKDMLSLVKSSEDAEQVADALIRSIGSGLSAVSALPAQGERREIARGARSKGNEQAGPQIELMRAWRVFLEAVAQQHSLILIIDDLQWADEALLDLLEYLADRITQSPILFICPARPDFLERRRDWGGGRRNITTIVLEALTKEETSELISGLLETHDLPEVLYHTIESRAEGNPFFVEEIIRMLIDQGVLAQRDGCWRISERNEAAISELASPATPPDDTLIDSHYVLPMPRLPDTVQGVLAARIDLLSQLEKQTLQSAAIIGRTFWLSGVLELTENLDEATVLLTLDTLIQRDFIVETEKALRTPIEHDRVFSFKHILIRDVVYNNIPRVRRSQKHAQMAIWLEETVGDQAERFAELLAYHYKLALATWSASMLAHVVNTRNVEADGDNVTQSLRLTRQDLTKRSIHYLTLAGDQAYNGYYTIRAIQAYSEALDLMLDNNMDSLALARMHQKLGDAYMQRANADEAWHEYSHALELMQQDAGVDRAELRCLYIRMAELSTRWFGWFHQQPGLEEVRAYIDAGLALLEGQEPGGEHAAFLTYLAMWYIRQLKDASPDKRTELADQAQSNIHEALHIAEEANDTNALWLTLDALGFIYEKQRKYQDAHRVHHRRQEMAALIKGREELHDLYISLGWTHEHISDYPAAVAWFGRAWRIAQTMESPGMLLLSMLGRMYVWYEWNRWNEVREVAYNIMQIVDQYQQEASWLLEALETLADIAYRTGDVEESDSLLRQYKRLLEQQGYQTKSSRSVLLAREDWSHAYMKFNEAVQQAEPFPSPASMAHLAELAVISGEGAEHQQAYCERAITLAEQSGERKSLGIALRARGRLRLEQEKWEAAENDLKSALEVFERLDTPWERGQTLYCLGLLHRRHADSVHHDTPNEREVDLGRAHLYFEQAEGFFESMKAVRDAERVRRALAQDIQAPI